MEKLQNRGASDHVIGRHDVQPTLLSADALLLCIIFFYLFINLFTLAGIPLYTAGDSEFFSFYAMRIEGGQQVYRDFFQFTPPGTDYIYLLAFKLFGIKSWVPNLINLLLGFALCWLTLSVARHVMARRWALLTTMSFLVLVYGRFLDPTHHWFSLFIILLAARVLIPARSSSRIAAAGVLTGISAFFTQTAGAAAWIALVIAFFYEREPRSLILRRQGLFSLAAILAWLVLSAPILIHQGWHTLWYFQVVYPHRYLSFAMDNPTHTFSHAYSPLQLERRIVYLLLLLTTPVALFILWQRRWRQTQIQPGDRMPMVLIATSGFFLMLVVIIRPNWLRLYAEVLPSLILFFAAAAYLLRTQRFLRSFFITTVWSATLLSGIRQTMDRHARHDTVQTLPAGTMKLTGQQAEEFSFIAANTYPNELFFQADNVHLYLPLALRSPAFVDHLAQSAMSSPEFVSGTIHALEADRVRYVVFAPLLFDSGNPNTGQKDALLPFHTYIVGHYAFVRRFPNGDELWRRRP